MTRKFDLREYGYDLYATVSPDAYDEHLTLVVLRRYSTGERVYTANILNTSGWSAVWKTMRCTVVEGVRLPDLTTSAR